MLDDFRLTIAKADIYTCCKTPIILLIPSYQNGPTRSFGLFLLNASILCPLDPISLLLLILLLVKLNNLL